MELKCGVRFNADCLKDAKFLDEGKHDAYLVFEDKVQVPITSKEKKKLSSLLAEQKRKAEDRLATMIEASHEPDWAIDYD